jgi:hypothetical protein
MTFLKDSGKIRPKPAPPHSRFYGQGRACYTVALDLFMRVDGRNLYFEARWPSVDPANVSPRYQEVKAQGQICIAAAFKPGTR